MIETNAIIAHDAIAGELYAAEEFAAEYGGGGGGEDVGIEVQHDPCCPGEIAIGARHESQRMDVATLYLKPAAAVAAATALLAAAAHAQRPGDFGTVDLEAEDSIEAWRAAHERAAAWVRETIFR